MPIIEPSEYPTLKAGSTPAIPAGALIRLSRDPVDPLKIRTLILRGELETILESAVLSWLAAERQFHVDAIAVLDEIKTDVEAIP